MAAQPNPKRRHHHVWQHYLKPWTTDGAIWCCQDGRIFSTGTRVLGVETDFYRVHRLTAEDVGVVRSLFRDANPLAQRNNEQLLEMLSVPFQVAAASERFGSPKAREAVFAAVDQFVCEALENYHTAIEAEGMPLLALALQGDISFYEDERCVPFAYFLATQYMRTKGIRERTIDTIKAAGAADLTRVWAVLVHMFASTIGASLYLQRRRSRLTLVRNETDVAFITGDQPVINLKADGSGRPSDQLSFYYPIAPNLALILPEVDEDPLFPSTGLTREQASELNLRIANASFRQVFASSEASLIASPKNLQSVYGAPNVPATM